MMMAKVIRTKTRQMMTMTKKVMTLRVKMIMKRKNKKNNVEENIGIG